MLQSMENNLFAAVKWIFLKNLQPNGNNIYHLLQKLNNSVLPTLYLRVSMILA